MPCERETIKAIKEQADVEPNTCLAARVPCEQFNRVYRYLGEMRDVGQFLNTPQYNSSNCRPTSY